MIVGRIREIWRFPVKSMAGERLESAAVGLLGIPGDRGWALRDETAGEIRGAKKWPVLMRCSARYREEPDGEHIPHVDITLPDGGTVGSDDPRVHERLSEVVGTKVTLWPIQPASDRAHYRREPVAPALLVKATRLRAVRAALPTVARLAGLDGMLREMMDREPDEPLPDFAELPPEVFEYVSPPGTYFDAFPIHLLTTASLRAMERVNPAAAWDRRRFRPNLFVETEAALEGLVEAAWNGAAVRAGEVELRWRMGAMRCGMTTQPQEELPKDPSVLRTIVRDADQNLGAYLSVERPGRVAAGDAVELA